MKKKFKALIQLGENYTGFHDKNHQNHFFVGSLHLIEFFPPKPHTHTHTHTMNYVENEFESIYVNELVCGSGFPFTCIDTMFVIHLYVKYFLFVNSIELHRHCQGRIMVNELNH